MTSIHLPQPLAQLTTVRQRSHPKSESITIPSLQRTSSSTTPTNTMLSDKKQSSMSTMTDTQIKALACICLCIQNSTLVLASRYSRVILEEQYLGSVVVLCMETMKFMICAALMFRDGASFVDAIRIIKCSLPMAVPGGIYVVQNGLQLVALQHLDAGVFSILSQLKILTTAVFAGVLLNQHQSPRKWRALLLLVVGAVLVQYDPNTAKNTDVQSATQLTGLLAIGGMVCCSGFAGIYLEKYLKAADLTLWQRNTQLSLWGILFALLTLFNDYDTIQQNGLFVGFSPFTWIVVALSAGGGLIVAVVVKYASTIIKGFATSASIIITSLISVYMFNIQLNMLFILGSICVLTSIFNYNEPADSKTTVQASDKLQKEIEQTPLIDVTVKDLSN